MGMGSSSKGSGFGVGVVLFIVFALVTIGGKGVSAQAPACASKLVPCANYLNVTSPPSSCCNPLKEAILNERECLCNLYKSPELFKSFGINITQALELPKHCGIASDLSACNKNQAPPPSDGAPPGTPGSNSPRGMAWIGMYGLTGLLLLWASVMV